MAKVIVLASGGLDSSLVMAKLLKEGHDVFPLFGDYNQYSREGEWKSINLVHEWLSQFDPESKLHPIVRAKVDVLPEVAASPGRVLAFCGAASIWAFTQDWQEGYIAIGIHKGDKDQDSCRVGYEWFLNETLESLTQNRLKIMTPLMGLNRQEMAAEIAGFGIPWEIMYNCYWYPPCGWQSEHTEYLCPGCRRKVESMMSVGLPDDKKWLLHSPNAGLMHRYVARRDWKYD